MVLEGRVAMRSEDLALDTDDVVGRMRRVQVGQRELLGSVTYIEGYVRRLLLRQSSWAC